MKYQERNTSTDDERQKTRAKNQISWTIQKTHDKGKYRNKHRAILYKKQGSCIKLLMLHFLWSNNSKRQTKMIKQWKQCVCAHFQQLGSSMQFLKNEIPLKHSRDLECNCRTAAQKNISWWLLLQINNFLTAVINFSAF